MKKILIKLFGDPIVCPECGCLNKPESKICCTCRHALNYDSVSNNNINEFCENSSVIISTSKNHLLRFFDLFIKAISLIVCKLRNRWKFVILFFLLLAAIYSGLFLYRTIRDNVFTKESINLEQKAYQSASEANSANISSDIQNQPHDRSVTDKNSGQLTTSSSNVLTNISPASGSSSDSSSNNSERLKSNSVTTTNPAGQRQDRLKAKILELKREMQ